MVAERLTGLFQCVRLHPPIHAEKVLAEHFVSAMLG